MAKFVELNEAAQMLGLSPDRLVEMRSNGEIHGYRDGASWKFKEEEIERVKQELGTSGGGDDAPGDAEGGLDFAEADGDSESILVSEEELGHSGESTSSTIIGKAGDAAPAESDLTLASDEGSDLAFTPLAEASDLTLDEAEEDKAVSDVALVPGAGDSDVTLVPDPGSDKSIDADLGGEAEAAGLSDVLGEDSELTLDAQASSKASDLGTAADTGDTGTDELGEEDSELALSEDDDMVLGGSGTGSDLTLSAADSGINLSSPTDSGLSLEGESGIQLQSPTDSGLSLEEEPLDLGGSSISSLELPEDEDALELEDSGEASAEAGEAEPVKKDEEFLLSPSDEMFMDESDSGSQVIALEDSAAFDQDAATMLPGEAEGQDMLAETAGLEQQLDSLESGGAPAMAPETAPTPASQPVAGELPQAPYSIWNVMGLLLVILFLSVSGIVMTDMVKNMWAWREGGHDVATGVSDGLTSAFGLRDE